MTWRKIETIAAVGLAALSWLANASPGGAAPFLYVFASSGAFAKVDGANGRIAALWTLAATSGIAEVAGGRGEPLLAATAFDGERGELFAAVPEPLAAATPGTRHYRVVRLLLPDLTVRGSVRLAGWLEAAPRLLLDARAGRLYVQWFLAASGDAPARYHVSVLSTDTLAEVDRFTGSASVDVAKGDVLPAWDSRFHVSGEPGRILGPDRILHLAGHGLRAERIAPDLDREQTDRAARYAGKASFVALPVDSQAGRTLFAIDTPEPAVATQLFFVRDASTGRSGPIFETPRGLGRLSADGRRVIVQEIDGPASRPASAVRATGRVLAYDADSGAKRLDLSDERLAGTLLGAGFACEDADGALLVWRVKGRLALVVADKGALRIPDIDLTLDTETRCFSATE